MPSSKYAELLARYEEELHRGESHSGTLGELAAARVEGGAGASDQAVSEAMHRTLLFSFAVGAGARREALRLYLSMSDEERLAIDLADLPVGRLKIWLSEAQGPR